MCGIVGIVQLDRTPVNPGVLEHMAAAIAHRGPDDEGILLEDGIGLAHKRLSIIDLTTGHQPMTSGPATIVFNGEIYNYIELRRELEALGHPFTTASDTEVILRAWLEWGTGCFERLNGMFAFLLYDRARGQVVAARDHFGIKPLYYRRDRDRVLFASEIKALLRHPAVEARPDYESLTDYLTFQFVLGDATLFAGIRKLEPASYLTLDLGTGAVQSRRYWDPSFLVDPGLTEAVAVERLRALLEDAIRLQVRSDVPVGTYLSGGMDSSFITAAAARQVSGLRSYTGYFREGREFDESPFARALARAAGVSLHEVTPTEDEFVESLPRLVYHLDEPAAGPGLFPQYIVARRAARDVKVLLGGQGGDEIFGGYARYVVAYLEQALKGAIYESNEEGEHIVSLQSILPNLPLLRAYGPMIGQFWRAGVFEPMDRRYFRLVDRSGGALSLYAAGFRDRYNPEAVFSRFQTVFNHPDTLSYFNKMTHFDLVTGLPALLQVEDRVSMAVSIESRVPLLDYRIVELVASLPPALKFRGAEMKYVFRRAVQDLVPREIMERKDKMGFPVPLHLWARGRCREFVGDLLLTPAARTRDIFDRAEVEKLMSYEGAFSRQLWGILNLELWFRTFM
ncbi:MAG: asparagine synthase (glutamine-hydrolyzing) [Gemmatimonadales bacterium]